MNGVELVLSSFLMAALASSVLVLTATRFQARRGYGIFLISFYLVFLVVAILTETGVILKQWKPFWRSEGLALRCLLFRSRDILQSRVCQRRKWRNSARLGFRFRHVRLIMPTVLEMVSVKVRSVRVQLLQLGASTWSYVDTPVVSKTVAEGLSLHMCLD